MAGEVVRRTSDQYGMQFTVSICFLPMVPELGGTSVSRYTDGNWTGGDGQQ